MSKATHSPTAGAMPQAQVSTTAATIKTVLILAGLVVLIAAPMFVYPIFLMKLLCFALFACAFNL
ncbi:branched-chain amino acid ABC transporter permease, partial [Paraburkholderia sp. SIMBA_009]